MKIALPNYTQTPNDLFDYWLPHLNESELKVLLVIIRKTFGFHKHKDRISLSQLEKFTGLTRANVCKGIQSLIGKGVVLKEITGIFGKEEVFYSLIVGDPNNSNQYSSNTPPSIDTIPPPVSQEYPQNKALNKGSKEQQQQPKTEAVVVSSFLEKIDIPQDEKEWISKHYPEEVIRNAVAFSTHPLTVIQTSLLQTIKWACKKNPQIPVDQAAETQKKQDEERERFMENQKYAEKLAKWYYQKTQNPYVVRLSFDHIELDFNENSNGVKIYFGDKKFQTFVQHELKKHGLKEE